LFGDFEYRIDGCSGLHILFGDFEYRIDGCSGVHVLFGDFEYRIDGCSGLHVLFGDFEYGIDGCSTHSQNHSWETKICCPYKEALDQQFCCEQIETSYEKYLSS
jgi:hypothetical protein